MLPHLSMFCKRSPPTARSKTLGLPQVCRSWTTELYSLFSLRRRGAPGSRMSPEAKAAGKQEMATAKGRPVTEFPMSQSPEDSISVIKPDSIKCKPAGKSLPGTKKETIVKLIGKKALAQCNLNGLAVTALLDTGAQVSMINQIWKDKYLPTVEVRPLVELMGMTEK